MHVPSSFRSFLQAGFECSTHRLNNGRRLDLIAATHHDVLAKQDYRRLLDFDIRTVREGLRWHLIEQSKGKYDFASILPLLDAAQELGIEQITDLFHFGWPDHINIFEPAFVDSLGEFAFAFARLLRTRGIDTPYIAPMNEISFFAWAAGDVGYINPFQRGRGPELKQQLVRAGLRAAQAFKSELPQTRLVWPDPVIHIAGDPQNVRDRDDAETRRLFMYEAWDMLSGRAQAELGGSPEMLPMIGVNFYEENERMNSGRTLEYSDPLYQPLHTILLEVWNRYRVPIFVSETGAEDERRSEWFAYVSREVRLAMALGIPVEGICLYPILNHPGWDDDRHCYNGLFDYPDTSGERAVYEPLALEIRRQQKLDKEVNTDLNTMPRQTAVRRSPGDFAHIDLICFSHLRWGFVYQRPQHLMGRFAKHRRVFFVEEPVFDAAKPELRVSVCPKTGVRIVVPALPGGLNPGEINYSVRTLVNAMLEKHCVRDYVAWFYTPMAMGFAGGLDPLLTIYDCMDELSLFRGAPPALVDYERTLLERANLVFTGGLSLFEAKCERHRNVYPFPSSVDVPHFARARSIVDEPLDQKDIPHPRIGYAGVIDERLDTALLAEVARIQPNWHFIMLGPVVKIAPDVLPNAANIHYLGMKQYSDLPAYFSSWDAAMLPFALNDATRFISPTKTPEYLAAGLPVVSTPIRDVIRPYGDLGLAHIAADAAEFATAMDQVMTCSMSFKWRERADAFLSTLSWDSTWSAMNSLILNAIQERAEAFLPRCTPVSQAIAMEAMDV